MKRLYLMLAVALIASACAKGEFIQDDLNLSDNTDLHFYGYAMLPDEYNAATRGVAQSTKLWDESTRVEGLTVKFLNGSTDYQEFVKEVAQEWAEVCGVRFKFVSNTQDAIIRIGFDMVRRMQSSWAYTGIDHLAITDQEEPTVHFARWNSHGNENIMRSDVLRAFGQVLGLELEFRHPNCNPQWYTTTDSEGNIVVDENLLQDYWEYYLSGSIDWDEVKEMFIEPLNATAATTRKTANYDPYSIMNWPFIGETISNKFPEITANEVITELSQQDKVFAAALYGEPFGDLYPISRYIPVLEFDYSGTNISMSLTANKNLGIIWDWEDKKASYITASSTARTVSHTYPTSDTRRITIVEFLDFAAIKTPTSNALKKFDLTTGENASNFDFFRDCNEDLEYIRIIGGEDFLAQTFNFTDYDDLKELYLVNINNSSLIIEDCDSLRVAGTGRYAWRPSKYDGTTTPIMPLVVDPGATPIRNWPNYPEKIKSFEYTQGGVSFRITDSPNVRQLILENVGLLSMSFSDLPNLHYLYLSSTDNYIVGALNNSMILDSKGGYLADSICTLPSRNGDGQGTGIAVIRCINDEMTEFVPTPIGESQYTKIMSYAYNNNWTVDFYSGFVN